MTELLVVLALAMLAALILILILAIIRLSGLWTDLEETIDAMGEDDGEWM